MFRHKSRNQRRKRVLKKKNNTREHNLVKDIYQPLDFSRKVIQQTLKARFGIAVHVNDLRNLEFQNDKNCIIGNSTVEDVQNAIDEIEKSRLHPYDGEFKHDMTRWSSSKKKQKEKNRRKIEKMEKNNF